MMEKGSFHTSPSPISQTDDLVRSIPLPNQMPKGIDFNEIPTTALNSATVESLINQNEDLMARLSVSLRKSNQLEEKVAGLSKENSGYRAKFEGLRDQFLVLQEKDKVATSRQMQMAEETQTAKSQLKRLEKIYSELYVQAQGLQRRMVSLERYRARIRKAATSVKDKARRLVRMESDFIEMKKSLSMAHAQSVNNFETRIAEMRAQIEEMKPKADERDSIYEAKVRAENQMVYEQRQSEMRLNEAMERMESLTKDLESRGLEYANIRLQLKETLVINESQRQEITGLKDESSYLKESDIALREQVESLQALWNQKQKEIERIEEKNRSLQNLNQSLSVNLNNHRKDIHNLKNELEKERFIASERIKTLTTDVQLLRRQLMEEDEV